jgi:nucleotide-binding universal stress UspA family protein
VNIDTILVPVDHSTCSMLVTRQAAGLAARLGARLAILHVAELPPHLPADAAVDLGAPGSAASSAGEQLRADALSHLAPFAAAAAAAGVEASLHVALGPVVPRILAACDALRADLVVIGTHGRTGLARLVLGSVAEGVAHGAHVPVMPSASARAAPGAPTRAAARRSCRPPRRGAAEPRRLGVAARVALVQNAAMSFAPRARLTLFLLAAACRAGAPDSGTTPDSGGAPTAAGPLEVGAGEPLWDLAAAPVLRLELPADWEDQLQELLPEDHCADKEYLSGTLRFENPQSGEVESWEQVGVRYRGKSSLREGQRWGLKLSFDHFVEDRDFHGTRKLPLMGTEGDTSLLREHLALRAMADAGVPASRVTHTRLWVNDVFQGVFPLTEEPDDQAFLDQHLPDPDGALYKVNGYCGGVAEFEHHPEQEAEDYHQDWLPKAGTDAEDTARWLVPMLACADQDDAAVEACLPDHVDVAQWLAEIAVDMLLPDVDGLAGAGQNFLLYLDPSTERFVVWSWDKDQSFSLSAVEDESIFGVHPSWHTPPPLVDQMRRVWREDFCAAVLDAADRLPPSLLAARIAERWDRLEPLMHQDPDVSVEDWEASLAGIQESYDARWEAVVAEAEACAG